MSDKEPIVTEDDIDVIVSHMSEENISAIEFIRQFEDADKIDIAISVAANMLTYALEKSGLTFPEAIEAMDAFMLSLLDSYKVVLKELENATVH